MVQPINRRAINQGLRRWPLNSATNLAGGGSGLSAYAVNDNDPATVADFAGVLNSGTAYYRTGGSATTFASMFSFSRASAGYYLNSSGVWTSASSGTARTGHHIWNGSSWVPRILIESPAATQLLHTTGTLVTQSVTVTAQPYTLHFSGTGTVTLSGASTAGPLVGTGTGEQNRVRLTFTPSAGTLTLTVSGTVSNAQLEAGSIPTSYIPNLAASGTVTRAAETLTIAGADMAYSATAMSFHIQGEMTYADANNTGPALFHWYQPATNEYIRLLIDTQSSATGRLAVYQRTANGGGSSTIQYGTSNYTPGINVPFNVASRNTNDVLNGAKDGTAETENATPVAIPSLSAQTAEIGTFIAGGSHFVGTVALFRQWSVDLGDSGIEAAST